MDRRIEVYEQQKMDIEVHTIKGPHNASSTCERANSVAPHEIENQEIEKEDDKKGKESHTPKGKRHHFISSLLRGNVDVL